VLKTRGAGVLLLAKRINVNPKRSGTNYDMDPKRDGLDDVETM
jgi:hypothetical protein